MHGLELSSRLYELSVGEQRAMSEQGSTAHMHVLTTQDPSRTSWRRHTEGLNMNFCAALA